MGQILEEAILCNIDAVALYPIISHEEGLASLRNFLDGRTEKNVTTYTFLKLAEIILKNSICHFNEKSLKQL